MLAAAVTAVVLSGCAAQPGGSVPAPAPLPVSIPLGTSLSTPAATWATVRTGGPGVGGKFWQLLVRPAGSAKWRLVTPPGVADNGGLAVAASGRTVTVGFVPSADLRFSPLAVTTDNGAHWSTGLLDAGLRAGPSALAALPGGRLLAITAKSAEESAPGGTHWATLVTLRALAATAAGRACGLTALTAAAASPSGTPLLGGTCSHPGTGYVFEHASSGWTGHWLRLHGEAAKLPVTVLQLVDVGHSANALLQAGSGQRRQLIGATLAGATLAGAVMNDVAAAPANANSDVPSSTVASSAGALGALIGKRHVEWFARGSVDNSFMPHPVSGATLAFDSTANSGAVFSVLVPGLDTVQVWQWTANGTWHRTQTVSVPSAPPN
jgi:hypothetical protein